MFHTKSVIVLPGLWCQDQGLRLASFFVLFFEIIFFGGLDIPHPVLVVATQIFPFSFLHVNL